MVPVYEELFFYHPPDSPLEVALPAHLIPEPREHPVNDDVAIRRPRSPRAPAPNLLDNLLGSLVCDGRNERGDGRKLCVDALIDILGGGLSLDLEPRPGGRVGF